MAALVKERFDADLALAIHAALDEPGLHLADLGAVAAQLSARRCEIENSESRPGGVQAIRGMVPLAEMFGYATDLRSATQGRGLFTLEFDHYAPEPTSVAKEVVAGRM